MNKKYEHEKEEENKKDEEFETLNIIERYPSDEKFFEILSKKHLGGEENFNHRCKTLKEMTFHDIDFLLLPISLDACEKFTVEYKIEIIDGKRNKIKVTVFYYYYLFEKYYHLSHVPIYILEIYGVLDDISDNILIISEVKAIDTVYDIWIRYDLLKIINLNELFERGLIILKPNGEGEIVISHSEIMELKIRKQEKEEGVCK